MKPLSRLNPLSCQQTDRQTYNTKAKT